ncbi:MAG: hypothetical protein K0M56_05990 [Kaistella sp.]|nr:hypothetical protein [Kaistella sp.]
MKKIILILLGVLFISCTLENAADQADVKLNTDTFDSFASKLKLSGDPPTAAEIINSNGKRLHQYSASY